MKFKQWSLDEISALPIPAIAETPSFLFLWVGSEHLDDGNNLHNLQILFYMIKKLSILYNS